MNVRILKSLACAALISVFANTAEARVAADSLSMPGFGNKFGDNSKPDQAKNFKTSTGKVYALATISDVSIGSSRPSKKHSASKSSSKKHYSSHKSSKRKNYASKSKSRSRHASRGNEGGSSRSCLQTSARALLNRIESRFGPVRIISTCRAGATIATSGKPSKHRYGMAIDFSAPGRKAAVVQWLIANHHSGGTMTYRDMDHIHVDVGYRFVSLGANSGRG
ncbi:MAG: D-Ala-D-Ala carboxypeptidase family metallohydrolase [Hyphomicrobium sp.]